MSAADIAIRFALAQIGKPYEWGAEGPGSFDCSGLMVKAFGSAGVSLPRTTQAMIADPRLLPINKNQLAPGDLVFPESGHVQMYLGGGKVVEAPRTGLNVRITSLGNVEYARRATTPATGVYGGGGTTTSPTSAATGQDAAAIAKNISSTWAMGLGSGIPKFVSDILAPIISWAIWLGEAGIGFMAIGWGIFLIVGKTGITNVA